MKIDSSRRSIFRPTYRSTPSCLHKSYCKRQFVPLPYGILNLFPSSNSATNISSTSITRSASPSYPIVTVISDESLRFAIYGLVDSSSAVPCSLLAGTFRSRWCYSSTVCFSTIIDRTRRPSYIFHDTVFVLTKDFVVSVCQKQTLTINPPHVSVEHCLAIVRTTACLINLQFILTMSESFYLSSRRHDTDFQFIAVLNLRAYAVWGGANFIFIPLLVPMIVSNSGIIASLLT